MSDPEEHRPGHLRAAAFRIARVDRLPIPPSERLTENERVAARLALRGPAAPRVLR